MIESIIGLLSEMTKEMAANFFTTIVLIFVAIISFLVRDFAKKATKIIQEYLERKLTKEQQDIINDIGKKVFANIEATFKAADGSQKMELALSEAISMLNEKGIYVNKNEIKAAINEAWLNDKRIEQQIKAMAGLKIDKILENKNTEGETPTNA